MKDEFSEGWKKAWSFLFRHSSKFLAVTIIGMFASGFMTWYGLTFMSLYERNQLLYPLLSLGNHYIFAYDAMVSMVLCIFFRLTKKNRYFNVLMTLSFCIASLMDVSNNIGLMLGVPFMYQIFQMAPKKILWIF